MDDVEDPVDTLFRCVDWQDNLDVEQALRELERRARIERRLEKWLRGEQHWDLRTCIRSVLGVKLYDYRAGAGAEWFAPLEADYWTALDAALDAAGAKESE